MSIEGDTRKGFLTPAQEVQVDKLKEWANKAAEAADGIIIKYTDNLGLEMVKKQLVEKFGAGILPTIYEIVDALFTMLPNEETNETSSDAV